MNRRDEQLLDRQLWGVSPRSPSRDGAFGLSVLAGLLAGIAIGGLLFTQPAGQPSNWRAAIGAISVPYGPPLARLR